MMLMSPQVVGEVTETENLYGDAQTVEQYVRDYYSDTPVLAEIARCESTFRHFDRHGNILRGVVNNSDVGVMQINTYYHGETAETLGFDIYTLEGNLGYGQHLYEREGTTPWNASAFCWEDYHHLAQR